jgi:hypothetical protein
VAVVAGCGGQAQHTSSLFAANSRVLALCKTTRAEIKAISDQAFNGVGAPYSFGPKLEQAAHLVAALLTATSAEIRVAGLGGPEAETALKRLAQHQAAMVEFQHEIHCAKDAWRNMPGWGSLYIERALGCGQRPATR